MSSVDYLIEKYQVKEERNTERFLKKLDMIENKMSNHWALVKKRQEKRPNVSSSSKLTYPRSFSKPSLPPLKKDEFAGDIFKGVSSPNIFQESHGSHVIPHNEQIKSMRSVSLQQLKQQEIQEAAIEKHLQGNPEKKNKASGKPLEAIGRTPSVNIFQGPNANRRGSESLESKLLEEQEMEINTEINALEMILSPKKQYSSSFSIKNFGRKSLTKFSKSSLRNYNSAIYSLDKNLTNAQKTIEASDIEMGSVKILENQKKEDEKLNLRGQVPLMKINDGEEQTIFDKTSTIWYICSKNRIFPMSVVIKSNSNDFEVYISRWDQKPRPSSHELRFFSKEFRVVFDDNEHVENHENHIYMTVWSKKVTKTSIRVSFAGIKSGKEDEPREETHQRFMPPEKRDIDFQRNLTHQVLSYLNYYQKNYIAKMDQSKLKKRELQNSLNDKVAENIEQQRNYPLIRLEKLSNFVFLPFLSINSGCG